MLKDPDNEETAGLAQARSFLHAIEDALSTRRIELTVGTALFCDHAPRLGAANFVRVDSFDPAQTEPMTAAKVTAETLARETYAEGLTHIVIDDERALKLAPPIAFATPDGEWTRKRRLILAHNGAEPAPASSHVIRAISPDEFVATRKEFLVGDPDFDSRDAPDDEHLTRALDRQLTVERFGTETNGKIVGAGEIYFADKIAQLEGLAVLNDYRCAGRAAAIVAREIEFARQQGASLIFCQITSSNERSLRLHKHLGFEQIGVRHVFEWVPAEP